MAGRSLARVDRTGKTDPNDRFHKASRERVRQFQEDDPVVQSTIVAPTKERFLGGAIILGIVLVLTGFWLKSEAARAAVPVREPVPANPAVLAKFSAETWFLPDDELLGFVEIPAGPFLMGSDPRTDRLAFENERWTDSQVQGTVDLPSYYIGRYEVTVAQFRTFVAETDHRTDPASMNGQPDHPVALVTWPDAMAYANWLDQTLRDSPLTPSRVRELLTSGWKVTLPTEAQWEKAARGTDGRIFPWGNDPSGAFANFRSTDAIPSGTTPVGSFECPECAYGLADMSGNVWELTRSPYRDYPFDPTHDRVDLRADALWVMRGGAFDQTAQNVRAALRGGVDPGARRPEIGFRLVISPS